MPRKPHVLTERQIPKPEEMAAYKELKMPDGTLVGYTCTDCGRLYEAPHLPDCQRELNAMNRQDSILQAVLFLLSVCGYDAGAESHICAIRAEYLGERAAIDLKGASA
jgi:hypothetical protein